MSWSLSHSIAGSRIRRQDGRKSQEGWRTPGPGCARGRAQDAPRAHEVWGAQLGQGPDNGGGAGGYKTQEAANSSGAPTVQEAWGACWTKAVVQ